MKWGSKKMTDLDFPERRNPPRGRRLPSQDQRLVLLLNQAIRSADRAREGDMDLIRDSVLAVLDGEGYTRG